MPQTSCGSSNPLPWPKGGLTPDIPTPWVGLAALLAMFVLPFVPDWLFEGPRTIRHGPRRHVCGDCNAPRTEGHILLA